MTAPLQTEETIEYKIAERHAEVVLRRFTKSLAPHVVNEHLIGSRRSMEAIWQLMGRKNDYELRQAWVTAAGWDGGWLFQNWKQLPEVLQSDLCKLGVKVLFRLLRQSMETHRAEIMANRLMRDSSSGRTTDRQSVNLGSIPKSRTNEGSRK